MKVEALALPLHKLKMSCPLLVVLSSVWCQGLEGCWTLTRRRVY
jgi:hypothetical protein